uniref:CST complex subunit STN1 isoform X1 n=1 Tax=Jaculus jaculus TaxID=51337 RepID=UPI001E1B4BA3|nr:CST complex subunit STN1 isoform X1 [Jaculus jaculus]XP_044994824.1 CST complex subunit STN1 isoform X1 [Jaculus jaculus]
MPLPSQSESSRGEEHETPSLFWGLDPLFLAFAKLYIRDIQIMKESHQVPGIFFYNGHPVKRVDVMGLVVAVRERDAFYSYGVDDATGVINCICWKKSDAKPSPAAPSTARDLTMTSRLKKLQETIEEKTKIEIGDVIQVRGSIRTFREKREIHATLYYKVDDPVWNIQIARMLEMPALYRSIYNQSFSNPILSKALSSSPGALNLAGLTSLLSEKIKEFLQVKRVPTFYQQELEIEESLLSVASQPVKQDACSGQVGVKSNTTSKEIHSVFKNAIQLLQEKGLVFQKDDDFDNLYYVTREDKDLHKKIHRLIQEDCQKPNHAEQGCHVMHILACARLKLYQGLSKAALQQVLELLEDRSDIISTREHYYMAL